MANEKRLIDANALCEGLVDNHPVVIYARNAPTVDAVEVVHGKWVDANGIRNSKCDHCGVEFCRVMDGDCYYCPNCGAKMDGDRNGR